MIKMENYTLQMLFYDATLHVALLFLLILAIFIIIDNSNRVTSNFHLSHCYHRQSHQFLLSEKFQNVLS